ncbi:dihydropteroate synthase [Methylibium petroleiphilum]|uniref:dihydropteroate synthase n=1 Tax=Methylibium petroleiphilum TaxID=105560 RepID=UPI001AD1D5FA|nr:dihydropteroate synthase [Methylibium petroleiphilum]MBN9203267.1 dihydropteroate synthase [Methylibium petroleiphilum]
MFWQTTRFRIDLGAPRVMGIVNVTPDSFSDGGLHGGASGALAHCEQLLKDGADILDIGGESTRPGSEPVPLQDELARVLPVLRGAVALGVPVSLDSYKPEVMRAALDLGVDIVNDIKALREPGALDVVAAHANCGVCLMHMRGDQPKTMQDGDPQYDDVVADVRAFLLARVEALQARGIDDTRITLDPGIGFGKRTEHNVALLVRQDELLSLGLPLLAGWSRKGVLGRLTGRELGDRLVPSVAAALASVQRGARIVRVHDVAATVDALKVWRAAGLCP